MKDAILIAREQNDDELWMELVNAAKDHACTNFITSNEPFISIGYIHKIV